MTALMYGMGSMDKLILEKIENIERIERIEKIQGKGTKKDISTSSFNSLYCYNNGNRDNQQSKKSNMLHALLEHVAYWMFCSAGYPCFHYDNREK